MTSLIATSFTYNPITGGNASIPWLYYYIPSITNGSSGYYTWTNTTNDFIPIVYVLIVGQGGIALSSISSGDYGCAGTGGCGGGQAVLLQFNICQPNDQIQIIYNSNDNNYSSSYCYLTYSKSINNVYVAQDLTTISLYYNNSSTFLPISSSNLLLSSNNTMIKTFYGLSGNRGTLDPFGGTIGGVGGFGGGGGGGGGGGYSGGSNGIQGQANYEPGTYGGVNDNSSFRDGGYTPIYMPDGTGTPLLGGGGRGEDGSSANTTAGGGGPGAPGSLMLFYNPVPAPITSSFIITSDNSNVFTVYLGNGYYMLTVIATNSFKFISPNVTNVSVTLVGGGGAGGASSYSTTDSTSTGTPEPVYDVVADQKEIIGYKTSTVTSTDIASSGGGSGGGGATTQLIIPQDALANNIIVNIGNGGNISGAQPTATNLQYSVNGQTSTITANPGQNGSNAVGFAGGVGGVGGLGGTLLNGSPGNGGNGGGGVGPTTLSNNPTNGTNVTLINNITYWFGGGGSPGQSDGPISAGRGGGGGNSGGELVNAGYVYNYTDNSDPFNPDTLISSTSNPNSYYNCNGLPNSGGGGAGADASFAYIASQEITAETVYTDPSTPPTTTTTTNILNGSTPGTTSGFNGGSGVAVFCFQIPNL